MKFLVLFAVTLLSVPLIPTTARAVEPIKIQIGSDYSTYSNDELRRRVWQLERAVDQLQQQVFQLALRGDSGGAVGGPIWTCHMESFGKTLVASGATRSAALAIVLQKCSDATNAVHCHESDVKCGND